MNLKLQCSFSHESKREEGYYESLEHSQPNYDNPFTVLQPPVNTDNAQPKTHLSLNDNS
jgi:hypothetical protein